MLKTQINLHPVQIKILRTLLFKKEARFSDLNLEKLTNDHFTFHINELVKSNLISKNTNEKYELTIKGKEFANRIDTDKLEVERQAKIAVVVVCTKIKNNKLYYLSQQRLKHPFFGFYGFVTGKIRWGENPIETAARELKEETNLKVDLTFKGIEHKTDYSEDKEILEDKYFFIFKGKNPKGKLLENPEGGKNIWITKKDLFSLPDIFPDIQEIFQTISQTRLNYKDNKFINKKY